MKSIGSDRTPPGRPRDDPAPDAPPNPRPTKWLWLAVVMAAAGIATACFSPGWPLAAIAAVAVVYAGTAISWHGVLLAEIARLSPVDRIGAMTGGVLLFTSIGIMVYPLIFGAILEATGSYAPGFMAAAIPALYTGLRMLLRRSRRSRSRRRV